MLTLKAWQRYYLGVLYSNPPALALQMLLARYKVRPPEVKHFVKQIIETKKKMEQSTK